MNLTHASHWQAWVAWANVCQPDLAIHIFNNLIKRGLVCC